MDSELLAQCRAGDPKAIETLVDQHQARLYRLCLSILDDADDAQDAVQETFIAALKALKSYRGESAFHTWLFSIGINVCRGQLRQRKRRGNIQDSLEKSQMTADQSRENPERQVTDSMQAEAVWRAVSTLDEKHRMPVILRYYHQLSSEEIAATLGINVGTVHSRLSNARTRLMGDLKRANVSLAGEQRP